MRRTLIDRDHPDLSVRRQCELLGLNRSSVYYAGADESELNLCLMRRIDAQYMKTPFYGSRRMTVWLSYQGHIVSRKRVRRLMGLMDLEAIYPKPRTTIRDVEHRVFPYLLRDRLITRPDEAWAADITYIPMTHGFMYLVAIIDWHSRYVLAWRLSNSLESSFCLEALNASLAGRRRPEIFNTDQGVQFTSRAFTGLLETAGVKISMDGKGRALDNVFIERLWWSVKYEHVYLHDHGSVRQLHQGLAAYFNFYCRERPHQSLGYRTPAEVYHGSRRKKST